MATFTDPNNLIDPELLGDYTRARYLESNKMIQSGILANVNVPGITESSSVVSMPNWKALGGMQRLNAGDDLNTEGLDDYLTRHPIIRLYKAVNVTDLATLITKGDPNQEVSGQVSANINRALNQAGMATLQGACASNTGNVVADTNANGAVTDFTALEKVYGDILDETLSGQGVWLMDSDQFTVYRNLGLVADPLTGDMWQDAVMAGTNMAGVRGSILGRNVIVDNELYRAGLTSKTSGDALIYLVGFGALASAVQKDVTIETSRDHLKKANLISWEVHRSMGVYGMDYNATVQKRGPGDSDLRNSSNWTLVGESSKFIPIASIQTNHA